jgi:hypothetical protein
LKSFSKSVDGGVSVSVPVVVFADVIFDIRGFTVTGIPHIFDSVVLTGLSFDNGLLGLHIAYLLGLERYETFQILLMLLLHLQQG